MISFNGSVLKVGSSWLYLKDNPNPLNLPPYTIRLKFTDGVRPSFSNGTAVQVSSTPNVWDLTYNNSDWGGLVYYQPHLIEVLGANTSSVTKMESMFYLCTSLTSVPLFDTSSVTNMKYMFDNCQSLTAVPLFDTSSVTNMYSMFNTCTSLTAVPLLDTSSVQLMQYMFADCRNVASGAYALYQQASSQSTPPTSYTNCFYNCGVNTTTGAAELAQIPSSWGGTGT